MQPKYDLDKIKFATDSGTFKRAVNLYQKGRVTNFKYEPGGFSAIVLGGNSYRVVVDKDHYDQGSCSCYLGQKDILCKHMVALAIMAVKGGQPLTGEEKQELGGLNCSGRLGTLTDFDLIEITKEIKRAVYCIKAYTGPSRIWFAYQNSLQEGCNRLADIFSHLPVSLQTAKMIIRILLRLDRKLVYGGVDDSDGTVGGLIEAGVELLKTFAKLEPGCTKAFELLKGKETCFDWEKPLLNLTN